jgi:hypothetical protein
VKLLAYTCVFDGYDRIFPPVRKDPALDYVVVTDDSGLHVDGWQTLVVDPTRFGSPRVANRYYKMLGHRYFEEYAGSIYVDGNIRMLGSASEPLTRLIASDVALGLFRHPKRGSVAEEIAACVEHGKTALSDRNREELSDYQSDGFTDQQGLVEATVLLKNHRHADLDRAMSLWWSLYERYESRDQFSLPYVLWRTGISHEWQAGSFRDLNPYFGIYPHAGAKDVPPLFTYLSARSYDSHIHRWCLEAWLAKWRLQRRFGRR